jgi:hypothetical protein
VQKEKEKKEKEKKENREEGFIEMSSSNQRGGCGRDRTTRRGCEKFECIS